MGDDTLAMPGMARPQRQVEAQPQQAYQPAESGPPMMPGMARPQRYVPAYEPIAREPVTRQEASDILRTWNKRLYKFPRRPRFLRRRRGQYKGDHCPVCAGVSAGGVVCSSMQCQRAHTEYKRAMNARFGKGDD